MILLTGATGYIGSHVWIDLLKASIPVIGIDNLSNSKIECLDAISNISGKIPSFYKGDVRDVNFLQKIFSENKISHVIHLAALKDIQGSLSNRNEYFDVNVKGLEVLLSVMRSHDCLKMIFSSSAAVYGDAAVSPINELAKTQPSNWYGETKLMAEGLLCSEASGMPPITSICLRYFNVAGRHSSGLLKNFSVSQSQSLFDQLESVANGKREFCSIYGDSWNTVDGTCVRDYVHVSDIAKGHVGALRLLENISGFNPMNLGSGNGRTVKEVVSAFELAIGRSLPVKIASNRVGDVAISYSDCSKAASLIGWSTSRNLLDMCSDQAR